MKDCTEDELLELMRQHKACLEEIHFDWVNIAKECGSWKQLLTTVRDEALVRVLGMNLCAEGDEHIYFRQSWKGGIRYLNKVIIGRGGERSWTRAIDDLNSSEVDSEAEEGPATKKFYPDPYLDLVVWI